MIIDFILYILWALIYAITSPLRLFSDVVLDVNIASSIETFNGYLSTGEVLFPVYTLIGIFGLVIGIEFAIFTYKGVMWLIKKIPTIN